MTTALIGLHAAAVIGLAVYGLLGFFTLFLFLRHRQTPASIPPAEWDALPSLTVQLPIFNERDVVERLIDAIAGFQYPRERLQIQVLDDSTDDTTALAGECVAACAACGLDIALIHRQHRRGFKAGALQEAFHLVRGDLIVIFDADFLPQPDFLLRTVPFFMEDEALGVVQTRWGHLNDNQSDLTGAQAVALDKHFAIEQLVRFRADLFPKFNGSAGVWRRSCILDVGGWQADTVCEDLCLSTRAVLAGWKFHLADDVIAPAELPATILAYKTQQARWAMGATQCLTKYGRQIWRAQGQSLSARAYALLSMSAYVTQALLLLLLFIQLPLLLVKATPPPWLLPLSVVGLGQPILFILAQQLLYRDWMRRLRRLPTLLLIAFGLAPNNTWAVARGLFGRRFTFVRTPKGASTTYRLAPGRMLIAEMMLLLYSTGTLLLAVKMRNLSSLPFLVTAVLSFIYIVYHTWKLQPPFTTSRK